MISFINDNNQSINYNGDFGLTKQVAYFRTLQIKGDVSVSFNVPNNSETREALGYYGYNQINKPVFSSNQFNLVKNGNVLMRGYLVIEEDNGMEFSLYFISGNANWFKEFDFSCKEIRNTGYQTQWTGDLIQRSWSNTKGIIFPVIDYTYQRNKFDHKNFMDLIQGMDDDDGLKSNLFPCLYINTLVDELGNRAGVKIKGTLLNDKLYQSLIITPEGPDLFNEWGLISRVNCASASTTTGDSVERRIRIQDIAPDIKAIEIIKWLIIKFGCVPTFDTYSNTLYLNITEKFKREDSEDWSEYIRGYTIKYNQYDKSYIRVEQAPEEEIKEYNKNNPDSLYGELLIDSGKGDGSNIDLYTDPFAPVYDGLGETALLWATPFVEFYKLEDDEEYAYTSVTSSLGQLIFNGVSSNYEIQQRYIIFRVDDDNGTYTGYHVGGVGSGGQVATSFSDFISDSTGTIYFQKMSKQDAGPRILVCIPNYPVSSFTSESSLFQNGFEPITNVAYAYYHKPFYQGYYSLNGYKAGLSYSQPDRDIIPVVTPPIPTPTTYTVTLSVTAELSVPSAAKFYYKINAGAWTLLQSTTVGVYSSYTILTGFTAEENDTVYIGVFNASDVNVEFGVTSAPSATYTGYCGQDLDTTFTLTGDITKYVNLKCTAGTPNTFTTC